MQLVVLGSGGFLPIPRAGCHCRICKSARQNGWPIKRHSPAIYLKEIKGLFDTPEDINDTLNFNQIDVVENIFYTHWHPDHTLGFRVVEILQENEFFKNKKKPINVYIPAYDYNNLKKFIPGLWYFETKGYITIKKLTETGVRIKGVQVKPLRLRGVTFSAYLLQQDKKKILLCPDHAKELPLKDEFREADLLIMNMGYFENNLKGAKQLPFRHRIRQFTSFDKDNLRIIKALKPRLTVFNHIEDKYNRTNTDLKKLEKVYRHFNVRFSVDGMKIKI